MKIVVIAVALLLLLGGGGGGYYYFFMRAPEQAAAKAPAFAEPVYFQLDTFVIPVMRDRGVDGYLRLQITLEVTETEVKRDIERVNWRLRDAILTDLHSVVPLRRFSATDRLSSSDVASIKARVKKIVDAQIGAGKLIGVHLEEAHDIPAAQIGKPRK